MLHGVYIYIYISVSIYVYKAYVSVRSRILFRLKKEGNYAKCYTWMNLKDMMLSERSQKSEKYLHEVLRVLIVTET
jgi:hypothetical protein